MYAAAYTLLSESVSIPQAWSLFTSPRVRYHKEAVVTGISAGIVAIGDSVSTGLTITVGVRVFPVELQARRMRSNIRDGMTSRFMAKPLSIIVNPKTDNLMCYA
jgi:hypothetical protein